MLYVVFFCFGHNLGTGSFGTGSVRRREVEDREGADAEDNIYFFNLLLTFGVKRVIMYIYVEIKWLPRAGSGFGRMK